MDQRLLGSARAYLDMVRSMIVVLRENGTISYVNEWTTRLMEYAPEEMVGRNFFDHFQPDDIGKDAKHNFQLLLTSTGGLQQRESYVKTGGGALILIHWNHSLLKDESGRILGTLSSGEDITEKRVLKERLAQESALNRRRVMQAVLERAEQERIDLSHQIHGRGQPEIDRLQATPGAGTGKLSHGCLNGQGLRFDWRSDFRIKRAVSRTECLWFKRGRPGSGG